MYNSRLSVAVAAACPLLGEYLDDSGGPYMYYRPSVQQVQRGVLVMVNHSMKCVRCLFCHSWQKKKKKRSRRTTRHGVIYYWSSFFVRSKVLYIDFLRFFILFYFLLLFVFLFVFVSYRVTFYAILNCFQFKFCLEKIRICPLASQLWSVRRHRRRRRSCRRRC